MVQYKWTVLTNTTIGVLMATIDGTIVLISLPAIFRGIGINPLAPDSFEYLLWILFGYSIVTATLLVTFGRISDMFGRVKFYNIGFGIFTIGSFLAYLTPNSGSLGAIELIGFRLVQGVGGAFLWSNSAAIVTDAFPQNERGQALGINMVAALVGSLTGIIMGGVLATYNWRYIFLVSVPVGIVGTLWSYLRLKEVSVTNRIKQRIDIWGNVAFAGGLTLFLVGVTYGLLPYGSSDMGWTDPYVISSLVIGTALLVVFPFIELKVKDPMFRLELFRNKAFAAGNFAGLLASIGRGGVQLMLIILLQGIWLPLHGYSYQSTPFWSGLYITPMLIGFVIMGPISGRISDRRGAKALATSGMVITAVGFVALSFIPFNFSFFEFAAIIFVMGLGGGMFAAPNTAAIMNASPAEQRGAASGMRATLQNVGQTASLAVFFSIVLIALAASLPGALASAVTNVGAPQLAAIFKNIPPTNALFAAFLGYNPVGSILGVLPSSVVSSIPQSTQTFLTGQTFFPNAIAPAFMSALRITFYIGAALSIVAAVGSVMRGSYVAPQIKPTKEQKETQDRKEKIVPETLIPTRQSKRELETTTATETK
jgi:EmrB/QacA subfamily drug resistance transporter